MKRHLALIGYRGCGKTSVGRRLSKRLGIPWCDTDVRIQETTGKTIPEIFALQGESGFRRIESAVLAEALSGPDLVLATGGGIILAEGNRLLLREHCFVVWLKASVEVIHQRINGDAGRPALTDLDPLEEIRTVMRIREPLYAGLADLDLDTGIQPFDRVVDTIADFFEKNN
ncbi:MAG TPA: shikimate kinase [Spirochaetota bacterium]|nr:shikimate kinase [Spirochaetota bacterium]HPH01672.1 shikimate kinase [Spirochaetota bacterium]